MGEEPTLEEIAGDTAAPNEFLMQFFEFAHLPDHLQAVSAPFYDMAETIAMDLPRNPERTTALRKLLEAKDCAVRAVLAGAK